MVCQSYRYYYQVKQYFNLEGHRRLFTGYTYASQIDCDLVHQVLFLHVLEPVFCCLANWDYCSCSWHTNMITYPGTRTSAASWIMRLLCRPCSDLPIFPSFFFTLFFHTRATFFPVFPVTCGAFYLCVVSHRVCPMPPSRPCLPCLQSRPGEQAQRRGLASSRACQRPARSSAASITPPGR